MRTHTCKFNFKFEENLVLENRSDGVYAGVYNNIDKFATPTMTKVAFGAIVADFSAKRKAKDQGGNKEKIAFKASTGIMRDTLFSMSEYVDSIAVGDLDLIKLAGYDATWDPAQSKGKSVPPKEMGLSLKRINDATNQLVSDCGTYPPDCYFLGILTEGFPLPHEFTVDEYGNIKFPPTTNFKIFINSGKIGKKTWKNLKSGGTYYCYYLVTNRHGMSLLSNEAKNICG